MFITILLQQIIVEIQNKFSEMSYPNLFLYVSVIEHMCVAIDHFEVSRLQQLHKTLGEEIAP